jgi:hypothetical protein
MTNSAEGGPEHDWARNADPLFTFLGLYLATFQWIEGQLDGIVLLAEPFGQRHETQHRLADLDNRAKVDLMAELAVDLERFPLVGRIDDWVPRVRAVVERLHGERRRRNRIMHSQYLLDGLEYGLPAIGSIRRRWGREEGLFDQEELSRPRLDAILKEIAELGFSVGMIAAQLRQAAPLERPTKAV